MQRREREVSQHRDKRLYAQHRAGSYTPRPHKFVAGDIVYVRQRPRSGMEVATKGVILQLVQSRMAAGWVHAVQRQQRLHRRMLKESDCKSKPWQARRVDRVWQEQSPLGHVASSVDWSNQGELGEAIQLLMPGPWHEGHRMLLSRKCREQKDRAHGLVMAGATVPALSEEEVEKRGNIRMFARAQVKMSSALDWGMELGGEEAFTGAW
ncbi:hypothetical protein CYMTET_6377 [Cymbomonas tetramitiformis]|uniref:Uncharacterized protein n=1 Tax=Cymbomonas tetramitiformis TaxID=36881 RepID=A0AAE0GXE0_9CHLO|nr:hypothetical protein CYMTET_6377 [Cymbomonas tetramitiformis]